MGFAYPGIGVGGATVPRVSHALVQHFGWQVTRRSPGVLVVLLSLPFAFFVKEAPRPPADRETSQTEVTRAFKTVSFYPLTLGKHVFHRRN
jgi:hypothetical protein